MYLVIAFIYDARPVIDFPCSINFCLPLKAVRVV